MLRIQMRAASTDGPVRTVEMIADRMADFREPLTLAAAYVREQTRQRYEARGFGEWPPLAESTVARKTSQGNPDPSRQLYAEGDLFESVTTAHGPFSFTILEPMRVIVGVDWSSGGAQIPVVLSEGTDNAGVGHHTHIPARPIWPAGRELVTGVSRILRNWVRAPVSYL
jgi:hypothetical protein